MELVKFALFSKRLAIKKDNVSAFRVNLRGENGVKGMIVYFRAKRRKWFSPVLDVVRDDDAAEFIYNFFTVSAKLGPPIVCPNNSKSSKEPRFTFISHVKIIRQSNKT